MDEASRLQHAAAPAQAIWLGRDFLRFFVPLHDHFGSRVRAARCGRREFIEDALHRGRPPRSRPPSEATGDWQVPPLPEALCRAGIEISGPVSITPMAVNALNPDPGGARAAGYLDDDEDSAGHCLSDTLQAVCNRCAALDGTLEAYDAAKEKRYQLAPGSLIDGAPVSVSLLGTALTLFHVGRRHAELGQSIHFYLPKMESPDEAALYRDVVAVCGKHGAVPIGGMATALPSKDDEINRQAAAAIAADKEWEAEQGFARGWVAHIFHMATAAAPFESRWPQTFDPKQIPCDPERHPIRIVRPDGLLTEEGTRRNLRTLLEYLHGWMSGRGAVAIDSLAGRPGKRPALMEDLATARISAAQTAQRLVHAARCEDTGRAHDVGLVRELSEAELMDIFGRLPVASPDLRRSYEQAHGATL